MSQEIPKSKIRIKTLNPDLTTISDRLVDQDIEFRNGPKEKHKGPMMIEVTLRDKNDHADFIKYLSMIAGDLPITERKTYKRTKDDGPAPEPIEELLQELKSKCSNQEEMIKYLRERSFVFCTLQYIRDMQTIPIKLSSESHEHFDYMVRRTKLGKVPSSDKYDPRLLVGFKIRGEKVNKVLIYMDSHFIKPSWKVEWPAKLSINYKKIALTIFPHYMTEEERDRWRKEHRKLINDTEAKPSKFYIRWKDSVKQPELPSKNEAS